VGAWLFSRASRAKKLLGYFEDLAGIAMAGLVAPAFSTVIGTFSLVFGKYFPPDQWVTVAGRFWVSDSLGILVVAPVLMLLARTIVARRLDVSLTFVLKTTFFTACVASTSYFIFFKPQGSSLLFVVFLPILIAAAWLGPSGAKLSALVIASAAVWATHLGTGMFAGDTPREALTNPDLFVAAISLTGMAVAGLRSAGSLLTAGVVLLGGWALSGWLYASLDRDRMADNRARFDKVINSVEQKVANRLATYEDVLRGAAGFLADSSMPSPEAWRVYVDRLGLLERYPGTEVVSVLQLVREHESGGWVAPRQWDFPSAFTTRPALSESGSAPPPSERIIIVRAEPARVALKAVGADMSADPVRAEAANRARDSGRAALTRSITLMSDQRRALQLFVPIYRAELPLKTTEDRRQALLGWVAVVFRPDAVFQSALSDIGDQIRLHAFDGEAATANLLYSSADASPVRRFEQTTKLRVPGSTWLLGWNRTPNFPSASRMPSALVAGCTALLTLLLAAFVVTLQSSRRRATALIDRIIESTHDGILVLELDGRARFVSSSALRLLAGDDGETDLSRFSWTKLWNGADRDKALKALEQARAGTMIAFEGQCADLRGSIRSWDVSVSPIKEANEVQGLVCVLRDITDRKQLESQLAHAQKLESIGQLAAGIAHEINTPIQYVGDNTRFLKDAVAGLLKLAGACDHCVSEYDGHTLPREAIAAVHTALKEVDLEFLKEETPKAIEQSLDGVTRVAAIVRAMKEFSHPGAERTATDLNHAIHNTTLVSKNEWKYVADLIEEFDPSLPPVPCIAGEINQVILNLIVNAAHAIEDVVKDRRGEKGTIMIRTRREGDSARIEVHDTGTGIPESARQHVFNLFYTTKEVGRGTGQGLAFAYSSIVQKHRGAIWFETEVGVGTTFIVRLPLSDDVERAA